MARRRDGRPRGRSRPDLRRRLPRCIRSNACLRLSPKIDLGVLKQNAVSCAKQEGRMGDAEDSRARAEAGFAPQAVDISYRADGTLLLRSPIPLGAYRRHLGEYLQ